MAEYLGDGIYRIGKAERLWSCRKDVMEGAVAEVEPGIPPADAQFGWFKGAIPTPPSEGFYVVEFLADQKVRVLAYVDMYGRAFTTETGFERPPAQQQDLFIARHEDHPDKGDVFVRTPEGETIRCASYSRSGSGQNAKYTIEDSWYDFEGHGKRLHYYDLMTRAYLAFVYRPSLGPATVPFGIQDVYRTLASNMLLPALAKVIRKTDEAMDDHLVTVHLAITKLRDRLVAANVPELVETAPSENALQLIRTAVYADTFYIQKADPTLTVEEATIWEMEAALNLFSLSEAMLQAVQARGGLVTLASCEERLIETAATQTIELDLASSFPEGRLDGEWQIRSRISAGIERMALPFRVEARFFLEPATGVVAFEMRVPDAQMFATVMGIDLDRSAEAAELYAMQIGLLLADIAFRASSRIDRVNIIAQAIERDDKPGKTVFSSSFDRDTYQLTDAFSEERRKGANTRALYVRNAREDLPRLATLPDLMEELGADLSPEASTVFAGQTRSDMQIIFDADRRALAERLADAVASAENTSAAVNAVRAIQDEIASAETVELTTDDARTAADFTRLLTALAAGDIDLHEQNATVNCFLGEDPCQTALARSQALAASGNLEEAARVLATALSAFEDAARYADTETTVYRAFDSYASRLIYNLIKAGALEASLASPILADAGKKTQLIPDSYCMCLFELATQLSAMGKVEEALQPALHAVRIAPTIAASYRTLGRMQSMKGDLEDAHRTLHQCLQVVAAPNDVAITYYNLAYVLWKSGDPETGLLCYLKSLKTSNIVAEACIEEVKELQEETDLPLPYSDDVDMLLEQAGIPLVPTDRMVAALKEGAVAALDEGLYDVARSLFSFVFHYHNDDALMNVLRSLENPLV